MKRASLKKYNILQLLVAIVILLLINYIGSFKFFRLDLTSEKRYTLAHETTEFLTGVDDYIFVSIYLDGELPVGFKQLKKATKELLDEFRVHSDFIDYEFIDPSENEDVKERNKVYTQLHKKGLVPTAVKENDKQGSTEKTIFPGALINYKGKEMPLDLLKENQGIPPEEQLNNSIETLEYELVNLLMKMSKEKRQEVAFIDGHGELGEIYLADIMGLLAEFYDVFRITINEQLKSLDGVSAIIIAKPEKEFSEKDKFIIDQFIMNGGKSLWLVDPINAHMDSLQTSSETIGFIRSLNIDDQLFKYGVRINPNLVQDVQAAVIPVNTSYVGAQPKWDPFPWYYFPLISSQSNHPIAKNLDMIKGEFMSTLDTVGNNYNVKKTILLRSSKYTKTINAPASISLDLLKHEPDVRSFVSPYQSLAVLLEGEFESVYTNRLTPEIGRDRGINFKDKSVPTKMIVVGDGDIIKNPVIHQKGQPYPIPLGSDKYYKQIFYGGNADFILNAVNYLCEDGGLMTLRTREVKLRMLDKQKVKNNGTFWKMINTIIPVLVIIILGIVINILRRRIYSR